MGAARATAARPGHRADVQGLRAVAVLAVVLYHAGVPGAGGGFVGVDVFFVISGFLITGLLARELADTGRVRLARFYGARARRLLPAGTLVLVASAVGSVLLLPPLQARSVLGDAVASALYLGNYRLAVRGTDYLAADSAPSPFQHYWSLGVEEQFYLLWPALLLLAGCLARVLRRDRAGDGASTRTSPAVSVVVLAGLAGGSFAVSLAWTRMLPPWAYFSLPSRAWELAAGGLVALTVGAWRRLPGPVAGIAGWAGLVAIVACCTRFSDATAFPGPAALGPVLGTALVLGAGCAGGRAGVRTGLGLAPLVALGKWSYTWYLWHWPVLVLVPVALGHPLGPAGRMACLAGSAGLAVATTRLVEDPVRFATRLRRSAARSLLLGGGATGVGVAASLIALVLVPAAVGHGRAVSAPQLHSAGGATTAPSGPAGSTTATPSPPAAPAVDPQDQLVDDLTAQVQQAVAASAGGGPVPANLDPPLAGAARDEPAVFVDGCLRSWRYTGTPTCAAGETSAPTTVALVGDSHAAMWQPAVAQVATQQHWRLETMAKVTCPLLDLPITSPYLGRQYTECEQWRGQVMGRLQAERPALVVLDASRRYGADFGFTSYDPQWVAALGRTVTQLRAAGAAVLVLGPVPDPHGVVPTCLSAHLGAVGACSPDRATGINGAGVAAEQAAVVAAGGRYADLTSLFCTPDTCPVVVGNRLVFRDDNHITATFAAWLTPVMSAVLTRAMARR